MEIVSLCNRELTESELNSIKQINGYLAGNSSFVLMTDKVGIFYKTDEIENLTTQEILDMTIEKLREMLLSHPDFSTCFIGDGYGLIGMMNYIFGVTDPLSEEEMDDEDISLETALITRSRIMNACEEEKFIAFVKNCP